MIKRIIQHKNNSMDVISDNCKSCKDYARELHKTYLLLIAERQRSDLYRQLIEQRYNLTIANNDPAINDMISHINSRFFDGNNCLAITNTSVPPPPPPASACTKPKKVFRAVPKSIMTDDEDTKESNRESIKEVEEKIIQENIKIFGEYDVSLNNDEMENNVQQLETVKSTKECTLILQEIKTRRQLLLISLSPSDYGSFLVEQIENIRRILNGNDNINKKLDAKKLSTLISRILTTLEQRIILHPGFQNQIVDADEISKYRQCLTLSVKHPKTYRVFDFQKFYDYFTNFSLALFSLSEIFEIYVANPYGYNNLCFPHFSNDNDYAFYFLEKYDGVNRYWTMDCRLEEICMKLAEVTRGYCTSLFRKIYKLCFGSNDYTEGYKTKYNVLEFDCEQLLRNILFTLNFNTFSQTMYGIVKKCCTVNPTVNDKFSSYADNEEQAISFKRYELVDSDIIAVIETVFDNIKGSQCLELYKNYLSTK